MFWSSCLWRQVWVPGTWIRTSSLWAQETGCCQLQLKVQIYPIQSAMSLSLSDWKNKCTEQPTLKIDFVWLAFCVFVREHIWAGATVHHSCSEFLSLPAGQGGGYARWVRQEISPTPFHWLWWIITVQCESKQTFLLFAQCKNKHAFCKNLHHSQKKKKLGGEKQNSAHCTLS